MRAWCLVVLAGCFYSEKHYVGDMPRDATGDTLAVDVIPDSPGPFDCAGKPLPTTAPDPIVLTGTVTDAGTNAKVVGATVNVLDASGNVISTTTTDAAGNWSFSLVTGGVPLSGHLSVSKTNYMTTYGYRARQLDRDFVNVPFFIATQATMMAIANSTSVTYDPTKATFTILSLDCNFTPIAEATIATNPAGTLRYFKGASLDQTATTTDISGRAIMFNVNSGTVTATAQTKNGIALRPATITASANSWVQVGLQP